jgi:cytochrome c oxidase subunit III
MSMAAVSEQRGKLHPQKLMMWMGMASMFMVFAGLTSAFILQKGSANWATITMPYSFWISTIAIILSSITMHKSVQYFKQRQMQQYKQMVAATLILGIAFVALQLWGFTQLYQAGIKLDGPASAGFLFVITGLHGAHMLGALVAMIILFVVTYRRRTKTYSTVGHEVMATFWHFVDVLWIYLLMFFIINFKF